MCVEQVIRVMTQRRVAVDEMVIKEGDRGDEMYIVDRYCTYPLSLSISATTVYCLDLFVTLM